MRFSENGIQHRRRQIRRITAICITMQLPMLANGPPSAEAPSSPPVVWPTPEVSTDEPEHRWSPAACAVKVGVRGAYIREQAFVACHVIDSGWRFASSGRARGVITGMNHPRLHTLESYHRDGYAWDFRVHNLTRPELSVAFDTVCRWLRDIDPRYRLVLFVGESGFADHLHVEFRHDQDQRLDEGACRVRGKWRGEIVNL